MKVLLIAADSPVRERLAEAISELPGIHIEIREPGDIAVNGTDRALLPDVVLIDIDQSHGRGLDIIRRYHGLQEERAPVIMAIASSSSLLYRESCLDAGAIYFFNSEREQDWLLQSLASIQEQLV